MIDIRCSKDGYTCDDCPIKKECDFFENNDFVDLWKIYVMGKRHGARMFGGRLLDYDTPITKEDILDELSFFKDYDEED